MEGLIKSAVAAGAQVMVVGLQMTITIPASLSREKIFHLAMEIGGHEGLYGHSSNLNFTPHNVTFDNDTIVIKAEIPPDDSGRWDDRFHFDDNDYDPDDDGHGKRW